MDATFWHYLATAWSYIPNLLQKIIEFLGAVGVILSLIKGVNYYRAKRALRNENIAILSIRDIKKKPQLIMGKAGKKENGFKAKIYVPRSIDDVIVQSIENKPYTIITGQAGTGKSRALYHYLTTHKLFKHVVVLERESLTCSMDELRNILLPHIKESKTLIYIDNFQDIKIDNQHSVWEKWAKIREDVEKNSGKIVFISRDKEFNDNETVDMPLIIRGSEEHKKCKEVFSTTYFSPIIGNYINTEHAQQMEKIPSELLLISSHNFITHYFRRNGSNIEFLKNVYNTICDQLAKEIGGESSKQLTSLFSTALTSLNKKGIFGANNKLLDEIFISELTDYLYNKEYTYYNNKIVPTDAITYTCSLLMASKKQLSYQKEKDLVKLLLSINPYNIEAYTRAITRATGQNTRRIAKFVQSQFNDIILKNPERTSEDMIARVIGIIASRIYYGWKDIVNEYLILYPSLAKSDDFISEILRIAIDERTSKKEKQEAIDYIHTTLNVSDEDLRLRSKTNAHIAINYEMANEDIDANRITDVLSLLHKTLTDLSDAYHNAISAGQKEEIEEDIYNTTRDICSWARIVSIKVSSYEQLCNLVNILQSHSETLKSLQNAVKAAPQKEVEQFTFISNTALWLIAQNIRQAYPLGYNKEYKKCIPVLAGLIKNESYIVDEHSFAGFMFSKPQIEGHKVERGVLAELKTFNQIYHCIGQVEKLSIINEEYSNIYIAWLYRLFSVIKTSEDFDIANKMLKEFYNTDSQDSHSIEGKRQLYNNLLLNAPWENAKSMIDKGEFLYEECDSATISSLFKAAKNEFLFGAKEIFISCKKGDAKGQVHAAGKLCGILDTIDRIAELSRSKGLKWDRTSYPSLIGIQNRLQENIKEKEPNSITNPKLEDYVANQTHAQKTIDSLYTLIAEIGKPDDKKNTSEGVDIEEAQAWSKLSVIKMKKRLIDVKQYFYEGILNETGRTMTSDKITNLLKHVIDMVENTKTAKKSNKQEDIEKDIWDFYGINEQEVVQLLLELVYTGNGNDQNKTLDAYIPVKHLYYEKVGGFLIRFKPYNFGVDERISIVIKSLRHLQECGMPICNKNRKNIFEILLSDLSFDDAAEMIDKVKQLAQLELYRTIYTSKSIVILCNKLKKGLNDGDEKIIIERIERINTIVSDENLLKDSGILLFFDKDDAARVADTNTRLRNKKDKTKYNNQGEEIIFPKLSKDININLPIASTNSMIRHAAWNMYDDQDCLYDIERVALKFFLYREMEYICDNILIKNSWDILEYYNDAMDLLHDEAYLNITDNDKAMSLNTIINNVKKSFEKKKAQYNLEDVLLPYWEIKKHNTWIELL